MRILFVVSLLAVLCPAIAMAQSPAAPAPATPAPEAATPAPAAASPAPSAAPKPSAASKRGGDITRDEYVEHAKHNAEERFDRMDADHNGVLTADERRAYHEAHHRRHAAPSQ